MRTGDPTSSSARREATPARELAVEWKGELIGHPLDPDEEGSFHLSWTSGATIDVWGRWRPHRGEPLERFLSSLELRGYECVRIDGYGRGFRFFRIYEQPDQLVRLRAADNWTELD